MIEVVKHTYFPQGRQILAALKPSIIVFGALLPAAALIGPAYADQKITSQVNVIGLADYPGAQLFDSEAQRFPLTITTYYKNGKARTEIPGGPVTIYDSSAGKVYQLFPDKTFTVTPMKDAGQAEPDLFDQNGAPEQVKVSLSKTEDVPGDTQVISGITAKKFLITGSLENKPRPNRPQNGYQHGHGLGGHGHFPGGGGFPGLPLAGEEYGGGYGSGANQGADTGPSPSVSVDGEIWLSDSVKLPEGDKDGALPSLAPAFFFSSPLTDALDDQIKKTGEIPLYAKITLTRTSGGSSQSVVVTEQLDTLSTDPLPDSLFAVPPDYQQVASQPVILSVGGGSAH